MLLDGARRERETTPYMTSQEAAEYVRATARAFDHWVKTRGVPCRRRGNIRLFERKVLDRVLANDALRKRKAG